MQLHKTSQLISRSVFTATGKQIWTRFPWIDTEKYHKTPEVLTKTRKGYPIQILPQGFMSSQIYWAGCFEPQLSEKLENILSPGDLFVDAGANIGYFTLLSAHKISSTNKKGRVISFEPCLSTFKILEENVASNGLSDTVVFFRIGLSDSEESKKLYISEYSELNTFCSNPVNKETSTGKTEIVEVKPLDSFYNLFTSNFEKCVIKIDVEGLEKQVLNGARLWLEDERTKHVVFECFKNLNSLKVILNQYNFQLDEEPLARETYIASRI